MHTVIFLGGLGSFGWFMHLTNRRVINVYVIQTIKFWQWAYRGAQSLHCTWQLAHLPTQQVQKPFAAADCRQQCSGKPQTCATQVISREQILLGSVHTYVGSTWFNYWQCLAPITHMQHMECDGAMQCSFVRTQCDA
jgi:hypothetical protein